MSPALALTAGVIASGCLALFVSAYAAAGGASFGKDDWELACDNTGTCRAAGYHSEASDDGQPSRAVTVLLVRPAGPGTRVEAQVQFGDDPQEGQDPKPSSLTPPVMHFRLDGRDLGPLGTGAQGAALTMTPAQTTALLAALTRKTRIEFALGNDVRRISDAGSTAVLLKMDDIQGRIGTPGALIRKGSRPESQVPPAVAQPVLQVPTLAPTRPEDSRLAPKLLPALRAALPKDHNCERLTEPQAGSAPEVKVTRLDARHVLASTDCWRAAYNSGTGYWVVEDSPPYRATLVTEDASDDQDGVITGTQKGRGIGDCLSSTEWAWNGQRFVQTGQSTTGMCRAVAAGGAWDLPTLSWRVIRPEPRNTPGSASPPVRPASAVSR